MNLSPSLPFETAHESGRLRVLVNYSSECETLAARQCHRILLNTSAAGVRPPEGVSTLSLDSVNLCMDIVGLLPKRNLSTAKRLKTSLTSNTMSLSQSKDGIGLNGIKNESTGLPISNISTVFHSLSSSPTANKLPPRMSPAGPTTTLPVTPPNEADLRLPSQISDPHQIRVTRIDVKPASLQILIDGALRLSLLSSINSKMMPGIKVKASTFRTGLAEITPTLWKPGYLLVRKQKSSATNCAHSPVVFVSESELATYY